MVSSAELRAKFLDYFVHHDHLLQDSSSLVPDDPTLLFTNAGMVPFKQMFIGQMKPTANKVTSIQRCVRAGGKHNDLENVGVTARHHTLFEMMGNFSFGDYFKEQAISYAWDFITNVCEVDKRRLYVTHHHSDLATKAIWLEQINIPEDRIIACGDADNFWSMGATGPCGPCTEIFYDHGPDVAGGPPGSAAADGDRFVEIWNLVFMQYNQDVSGSRTKLPKPCVDTGVGLERLTAVLQGVFDNYDIDQFKRLRQISQGLAKVALSDLTHRVIADHVRAIACLLNDGVMPSNEGRGYVLRRIIRRAECFKYRDGHQQPLLSDIIAIACEDDILSVMQQHDLAKTLATVRQEEHQFAEVYDYGSSIIADILAAGATTISGAQAFKLYDTYGLPLDLTKDLAGGVAVDEAGFDLCMQEQKQRSRTKATFAKHNMTAKSVTEHTSFIGYEQESANAKIVAIYDENWQSVTSLTNVTANIVLDKSVFYAESGGQVADVGLVTTTAAHFTVADAQHCQDAIVLTGEVVGKLQVGQMVTTEIDSMRRAAIKRNHSATHLLHAALRKFLGAHVEQKGSLVEAAGLRFDFSHTEPVSRSKLRQIESWVLAQIRANHPVTTELTSFSAAKSKGAMALFEGKYADEVRLLSIADISLELCGGTHVANLSEIGNFAITAEAGVAAGVRRISAVTAVNADQHFAAIADDLFAVAQQLSVSIPQIPEKITALGNKFAVQKQSMQELTSAYVALRLAQLAAPVVVAVEATQCLDILTAVADGLIVESELVVLLSKFADGRHNLLVLSKALHAGALVKFLAGKFAGKGGGKPVYARGQLAKPVTVAQLTTAVAEFELQTKCK